MVLLCARRLARLDFLIKRRPELLSSVMLRQNPHNVHEWHKRVKLFDGQPERQIKVFAEAVATVDPDKVGPAPTSLPSTSRQIQSDPWQCVPALDRCTLFNLPVL